MISFEEFWNAYPRKVGKLEASRVWRHMTERDRYFALKSLELWKQTVQWTSDGGKFTPYGSTFLRQQRYFDEPWTGAFKEAGIQP